MKRGWIILILCHSVWGQRSRIEQTSIEIPFEYDRYKTVECTLIKLCTHIFHDEKIYKVMKKCVDSVVNDLLNSWQPLNYMNEIKMKYKCTVKYLLFVRTLFCINSLDYRDLNMKSPVIISDTFKDYSKRNW